MMQIKKILHRKLFFLKGFFLLSFLVPIVGLGCYNFFHLNDQNQFLTSQSNTDLSHSQPGSDSDLKKSDQKMLSLLKYLGFNQKSWNDFNNEKLDEDGLKIFLAAGKIKSFQKFYKENSSFLPGWNQISLKNLPSRNGVFLTYQHLQFFVKLIAGLKMSNLKKEETQLLLTIIKWLGLKFEDDKLQKPQLAEGLTILANWFDSFMKKYEYLNSPQVLESDPKDTANKKEKTTSSKKDETLKILTILKNWGFSFAQVLELSKVKLTVEQKNLLHAIVMLTKVAKKGTWPLINLLTSSDPKNGVFKRLFILFLYTDLPLPINTKNLTIIKNKIAKLKKNWTTTKFQQFKDILVLTRSGIGGNGAWILAEKINDLLDFSSKPKIKRTFATVVAERISEKLEARLAFGTLVFAKRINEIRKGADKWTKSFGNKVGKVVKFLTPKKKNYTGIIPILKKPITDHKAYYELWRQLKYNLPALDTTVISKVNIGPEITAEFTFDVREPGNFDLMKLNTRKGPDTIVDFHLIKSELGWEKKDFKDLNDQTKREVAKLKVLEWDAESKHNFKINGLEVNWIDLISPDENKNLILTLINQHYGPTWKLIRPYVKRFKNLKKWGINKLGDLRLDPFFLYIDISQSKIKRYFPIIEDYLHFHWRNESIIDFSIRDKPSQFVYFGLEGGYQLRLLFSELNKMVGKTKAEIDTFFKNAINEQFASSFQVLKVMLKNVKFTKLDEEYKDIIFSFYDSDYQRGLFFCINETVEKGYSSQSAKKICLQDYDKKFPLKEYLRVFDFTKIKQDDLSVLSSVLLDKLKFFQKYQKPITTLVNDLVSLKLHLLTNQKAKLIWDNFTINGFFKLFKNLQTFHINKILLGQKEKAFFFDLNQFSLSDLNVEFKSLSFGAKRQLINLIDTDFSDFANFKKSVNHQIDLKYTDFWKLLQKGYQLGFQDVYNSFFTNQKFINQNFINDGNLNTQFHLLSLTTIDQIVDLYQSHEAITKKLSLLIAEKFTLTWTLFQSYLPLLRSIKIKQLPSRNQPSTPSTESRDEAQIEDLSFFSAQNFLPESQDLSLNVLLFLQQLQSEVFANQIPILVQDIKVAQTEWEQAVIQYKLLVKDQEKKLDIAQKTEKYAKTRLNQIKEAYIQYQTQKQREQIAFEKYLNEFFIKKYFVADWKVVQQNIAELKQVSQIDVVKKTADKIANLFFVKFWEPIWNKLRVKLNFLKQIGINQSNIANFQKLHLNSFFHLQDFQDISQFSVEAKKHLVQIYPQLEQINAFIEQEINLRYGLLWKYLVLAMKLKVTSFLNVISIAGEVFDLTFFNNSNWFKFLPAQLPSDVLIRLNQFYVQKEEIIEQLVNFLQNLKIFKKDVLSGLKYVIFEQFNQILPRLKGYLLWQKFKNEQEVWDWVYKLLKVHFNPSWTILQEYLPKLQILGIRKLKSTQFFQNSGFFDLTPFLFEFGKVQFVDLDFAAFKELKKLVGMSKNDWERVINNQLEKRFGSIWKTTKSYLVQFQEKSIDKLIFDDQNKLLSDDQIIDLFPFFAAKKDINVAWINADLKVLTELNKIYAQKENWNWKEMLFNNLINSEDNFDLTSQSDSKKTIVAVASGVAFFSLASFVGLVWWIRRFYSG